MARSVPRKRSKRSALTASASGAPMLVPPKRRTRVTNGSRLYLEVRDQHSPAARRLRDLIALTVSDLGGADICSEAEKSLVRRASMLTLQLELLEQKWAQNGGKASDKSLTTYQRVANSLRRILESIGLKHRSRDVTPDLQAYLRQRRAGHEAEEDEVAG